MWSTAGDTAMNQPDDYYGTVIRERGAPDAADVLADCCRKKDTAIRVLEALVVTANRQTRDAREVIGHLITVVMDFHAAHQRFTREPDPNSLTQFRVAEKGLLDEVVRARREWAGN